MTAPASATAPSARSGATTAPVRRIRLPKKLRNLELGLLIFACAINAIAVVLVELGALGHLDFTLVYLGAGLSALVVAMHVVMRYLAPDADPFILPIATALNGIGIAEIYRIDIARHDSGWESAAVRQIVWTAIAVVCAIAVIVLIRNHRVLQRYTYVFGFGALVLLLLPMLPLIGRQVNGARVWIGIGSFSFQPGELAKIALAIFFAGYLVQARDSLSMVGKKVLGIRFPRLRDLGPILVLWAISMAVIVFQHDLGTGLLYFGLFLVMIYVATARVGWVVIGLVLFIGGALIASRVLDYVQGRFQNWLNPFNDHVYNASGGSYQLVQGLFGLSHGGLLGTGLDKGIRRSRRWRRATTSSPASARSWA
jgi:cell division protein FtsW (lipid II flippase)